MSSSWFLAGCLVVLTAARQLEQEWTNFVIFDSHYLPMAKCWFKWFRRNASPNYLKVGCMDPDACEEAEDWRRDLEGSVEVAVSDVMESYDLDPVTAKVVQPHGAIEHWSRSQASALQLLRKENFPRRKYIHLFHRMIWDTLKQRQQDVLHLDVDALWLKPPDVRLKAILEAHPDVDLIASSSRESNPRELVEKWGFVLNVGFILYRSTEKVQLLFDEELLSAPEPSCQQLLNYALDRKGCQWSGNDTASTDRLGRCGELKVVALSQTFASRSVDLRYDAQNPSMPTIAHPDSGLLSLEGIKRMRKFRDMNLC
eukprot:s1130_g37.t1